MILLDTCALLWWTLEPEKLSPAAARRCRTIRSGGAIVSSISLWEIGLKIKKGKLDIGISVEEFVQRIAALGTVKIIPVDETVWLQNLRLDWNHADTADRTIVATAMLHKVPVVTADTVIAAFYRTIW